MESFNFIIVDEHPLFCFGLETIIKTCCTSFGCFRATCDSEVIDLIHTHPVNIIFMNFRMPELDSLKTVHSIKCIKPEIKIVGLLMHYHKNDIQKMVKAGTHGYLLKSLGVDKIEKAVFSIINGGNYFPGDADCCFLKEKQLKSKEKINRDLREELTEREQEILILICEQFSTKEISKRLGLSEKTIEIHRGHIIEKTHSKNMIGLAFYAIEKGLIKKSQGFLLKF